MSFTPDSIHALATMLGETIETKSKPPTAAEKARNPAAGEDPLFPTVVKTNDNPTHENQLEPEPAQTDNGDIWDNEEVEERDYIIANKKDHRMEPEYEIVYRQQVTAEDCFLGVAGKDSSARSCDAMVIKVKLPDATSVSQIELEVLKDRILCRSRHQEAATHTLSVTVPVDPTQ